MQLFYIKQKLVYSSARKKNKTWLSFIFALRYCLAGIRVEIKWNIKLKQAFAAHKCFDRMRAFLLIFLDC